MQTASLYRAAVAPKTGAEKLLDEIEDVDNAIFASREEAVNDWDDDVIVGLCAATVRSLKAYKAQLVAELEGIEQPDTVERSAA